MTPNTDSVAVPHPGGEGGDVSEPLTLSVPIGEYRETDLMAALEFVVIHWHAFREQPDNEIARAVSWLSEKYGSP